MSSVEYHLRELEIAQNADDPRKLLPQVLETDEVILDVGCGIGQTLIALGCFDKQCIGIDIDRAAIAYGKEEFGGKIELIVSGATEIPLESNSVDFVFSRVALPYTNIPRAIQEMHRVLRPDGRFWLTLHSRKMAVRWLGQSLKSRKLKDSVYRTYVVFNGYLLKYAGVNVPFLNGSFESWQDIAAMKRLLERNSFEANSRMVGNHTVVQGRCLKQSVLETIGATDLAASKTLSALK